MLYPTFYNKGLVCLDAAGYREPPPNSWSTTRALHGASNASITTEGAEDPRPTGGIADDSHKRLLSLVSCRPIGRRGTA